MNWKRRKGTWSTVIGPALLFVHRPTGDEFVASCHVLTSTVNERRDLARGPTLAEAKERGVTELRFMARGWCAHFPKLWDAGHRILEAMGEER